MSNSKASNSKNPCAKTRPINNPYEIWETIDGSWQWLVLKKYQTPEKEQSNPYARWFTFVKSPFVPEGEYGDIYVKDIKDAGGIKVKESYDTEDSF